MCWIDNGATSGPGAVLAVQNVLHANADDTMPAVGYVYFVLGQRLGSFRTTRALGRAALEVADEVLTGCGDVWGTPS